MKIKKLNESIHVPKVSKLVTDLNRFLSDFHTNPLPTPAKKTTKYSIHTPFSYTKEILGR